MILNAYAHSCLVWEIGTYISSIINTNTAACMLIYTMMIIAYISLRHTVIATKMISFER
jgi:hypothetical protein